MDYNKENILLRAEDLSFSYDGKTNVIDRLSFTVPAGRVTVLMGANGCGKSTLFHLFTGNLTPSSGKITLNGRDIRAIPGKEFAKSVAIVHQNNVAPPDITVERLVSFGRTPHLAPFQSANAASDREAIAWAIRVTGTEDIKDRALSALSGGQRQRAWIAMALAQKTPILFLDEPTTFLDIRYQIEILRLIRTLNVEHHITIVMVLHDINQAAVYGDIFVGMRAGRILTAGAPDAVVTEELLNRLYDIRLKVLSLPKGRLVLTV